MAGENPSQHHQTKLRAEQGQRLPADRRATRAYYCRSCGYEEQGTTVPQGWYLLNRVLEAGDVRRLGLYCTMACLIRALARLAGIERELGPEWEAATAALATPPATRPGPRRILADDS